MKFKRAIVFILTLCLIMGCTVTSYGASAKLKTPTIKLTTVASTGKTKVSWDKVDKAVSYKVYTSTNKTKWTLLKTTTNKYAVHSKATAGKKYYYKVKAIAKKSTNNSYFSAVKSKICQYKYPVKATVAQTGTYPKVTWNKITGASKYKVYRSYSKTGEYTRLTITSNLSYTDKKAKGNKTVYYKVTAINSKGNTVSKLLSPISIKTKPEAFTVKYVAKPSAALYKSASSSSGSITVPYMAQVKVGSIVVKSSTSGAWYKVYYNGKLYYTWINNGSTPYVKTKSTFTYTGKNKYQQEAVDLAKEIAMEWDTYYDYNTDRAIDIINSKGQHGFDCSGFVVYILTSVVEEDVPTYWLTTNIKNLANLEYVYNKGYEGEYKPGKPSLANIQPGDIIFFNQNSKFDHCGIYLGNGEFAHASNFWANDGVCIMPLVDEYLDDIQCIRRYIPKPENVKPANKVMTVTANGDNYCNSYVTMDSSGEKAVRLYKGDKVTLLFTHHSSRGNYGYIRTEAGEEVFVLLKNIG